MALYRPGRMAQEDFQEMMQEIVPELLQQVLQKKSCSSPDLTDPPPTGEGSSSSSSRGTKRSIESADADGEPVEKRPHEMEEDLLVESATFAMDEIGVCSVELLQSHSMGDVHDGLDHSAKQELVSLFQQGMPCEVLVAAYTQKKAAKEIPVTGNPPEIQKKVDEAKLLEWNTIEGKHAGRVVLGTEADDVRRYLSHRIMGSRYVMTLKVEDDAAPRFKARWCLQGHLGPDLTAKAELGDLQSPTLSQVGRNLIFQLLASHQWEMQLGDIKGAFLSAGNLPQRYKPLYASLPKGGIPGIPDGALIEVLGHVYGLNDSPAAWYKKLSHELIATGFERSRFDSCLYYFRENGKLTGIYGVHVDDCVTGGCGAGYRKAIAQLKQTFEFRKWRTQNGDFCGAQYVQDPKTFEVIMKQERFVQKVKPLHLSRDRSRTREALLNEKEEHDECARLILKARRLGAWKSVWQQVIDTEDLIHDGPEPTNRSPSGTMSDGSKRLRDEHHHGHASAGTPYHAGLENELPGPMPSSSGGKNKIMVPDALLPPGISSLDQWGQCYMSFGKFKDVKTYREVFESKDESMAGYRKFCMSHCESGSAGLKDFVHYMNSRGIEDPDQTVIPGSGIRRRDASSEVSNRVKVEGFPTDLSEVKPGTQVDGPLAEPPEAMVQTEVEELHSELSEAEMPAQKLATESPEVDMLLAEPPEALVQTEVEKLHSELSEAEMPAQKPATESPEVKADMQVVRSPTDVSEVDMPLAEPPEALVPTEVEELHSELSEAEMPAQKPATESPEADIHFEKQSAESSK
ncbi:Retrovirus-related Pol polyprotein from transposon RE1 (Retro element 1) (AtRE1) [Includes: Protease RE1, partial [Durusdinium trenchii]